jgi:predicted neuraminidase
LANPNSGLDAVALKDGRIVMVYNDTSSGRSPLNLAVSSDGENWHMFHKLEDTPGGEFSYPAIIQAQDGSVHVVYTWNRKRMKHVVLPLSDVPGAVAGKKE